MKYDIITMGSAVVDVFIDTDTHERHGQICYPTGDKILIEGLVFRTGGGGTNTAIAFSKLGFKVGFIGKLGRGQNAGIILRDLKKEGVGFLGVKGNEHTGYSVILDSLEHNRTILIYKGANDSLTKGDLNVLPKAKWLYCSSMMGKSFRTQEHVVCEMHKKGSKIALNPSLYQVKKGAFHLRRILKCTEVLILNKEEALILVGLRGDLFKNLRKLGPRIVVVTDGRNGNSVYDGGFLYRASVHKSIKCVERTGAGDAFASGFVAGLIKRNSIRDAIQIGSLNSESAIQKAGAKNGLLSWSGVMRVMKKTPVKITKRMC